MTVRVSRIIGQQIFKIMDVFRQMQRYEAGDEQFQRRVENESREKQKIKTMETPSKYSFGGNMEARNNQKTLTWSSPLVYSPQAKFSPKVDLNFSGQNNGQGDPDPFSANQRPQNSNKYVWNTSKNCQTKNKLKFPLGDKEYDQEKTMNSTQSTLNTTDDISEVCSSSFMESLGNSRGPRRAPSCAGDYYSQIVSQSQKELRRQALAVTQKPMNLVTEKPIEMRNTVKQESVQNVQIRDVEEAPRPYECMCLPPRNYYRPSRHLGLHYSQNYSGPMFRPYPDRRTPSPYFRPPQMYMQPEEQIFEPLPEIPIIDNQRMFINSNWVQPQPQYGLEDYYPYSYDYDPYRPIPQPRPRNNFLLNRYLHQIQPEDPFKN